MAVVTEDTGFTVWGVDQTAYGPVELPTLVSWVKDERVTADTWIFAGKSLAWQRAGEIPELQMFFRKKGAASSGTDAAQGITGMSPRALRRVKILAELSDDQLERLSQFVQIEKAPQWNTVVKQGDRGDTMYLILDGELRVRISVMGKETILATLAAGEFFGDMSMFDHGPRAADVVANQDSTLVKISATSFQQLAKDAPDLATPLLMAIGRSLTGRIRADNKRHENTVKFSAAAH